jgi:lysophospholipase L1-like esterase
VADTASVVPAPQRPRRSFGRKLLFVLLSQLVALLVAGAICEGIFRVLEMRTAAKASYEGQGGIWFPDGRWGWKPAIGDFKETTFEFSVTGSINSLYMNDVPFVPGADDHRTRILALGDSHTYAVGASTNQTWPKVLEQKLNADHPDAFRVYNGGIVGFNVDQDLLRLIDYGPIVKPHYVIYGLSYATNLYNLLPPDHGGWIYGDNAHARDYFDLDDSGALVQKRWLPTTAAGATQPNSDVERIRRFMDNFATFRFLRRSKLALMIGSHLKIGGQSLWPNVEVIVEKEIPEQHRYQWKLFEAVLDRMNQECIHQHAQLIVVGIPYLPQVYDEIWDSTFGGNPRFSRTAGIERVRTMCAARGITYIDTRDALHDKARELGHWVHYHHDAHPTPEGHEVIAETIFRANAIKPLVPATQP